MIVLWLLAVVSPAAQAPRPARSAPGEILVKFRSQAAEGNGNVNGESWLSCDLQALHSRWRVREMRPLVQDFERHAARLQALRTRERPRLTWQEQRMLRRLARGQADDDGPDLGRIYRIRVDIPSGERLETLLDAYRRHPDVEYAELNRIVSICAQPSDPSYARQWALEKIAAAQAWDTSAGGEEIVVAVIDTGLDYSHRDLRDNLWLNGAELQGADGVDDDENGYIDDVFGYNLAYNNSDPLDDHGHGTTCAGIIGSVGDNGLDTAGVCWIVRIMAVKILDADGEGTSADAAQAIHYAVANGADVISGSWGGEDESQAMKDAVAYARRQGVLVVAAAGNEDTDAPFYPAAYPGVIAVTATESSDRRWSLANYGDWVDLAAPGRDILSLRAAGTSAGSAQDAFTTRMSGTSMAAPHVAGICALLLSANPLLSCDEVEQMLLSSVDPIAAGICASNGRVNAAKAMRAVVPEVGAVRFDRSVYADGAEVGILLADWDLRGYGTHLVQVETDGGDVEYATVVETAAKGVFRGALPSERGETRAGDGRLQIEHAERIVARHADAGGDGQAYAYADYEAPVLLDKTIEVRGHVARIELTSSERTRADIRYGDAPDGPFTQNARAVDLSDRHGVRISGLTLRKEYAFDVVLTDEAGNVMVDDNAGEHYSFQAGGDFAGFHVPGDYPTIQAAVNDAWDGDTVWVADGTYSGPGNIEIDFYGRAISVRSENGPQACVIDCRGEGRAFHFHSGEGENAVVEGFTITKGDADYGGAIRCVGSSPTIRNCVLRGNSAEQYGGGLCNSYGSSTTVISCIFEENVCSASRTLGRGGGMANRQGSHPTVEDCTFIGNRVSQSAGAMGNFDGSSPRVVRCMFTGNSAGHSAGAVGNWDRSQAIFTQCVFSENSAGDHGGGVYNRAQSDVTLTNCIFHQNAADRQGGAIGNDAAVTTLTNCTLGGNRAGGSGGGVWNGWNSRLHIENCILWANVDGSGGGDHEAMQIAVDAGTIEMDYCCVEGLTGILGGTGNIGSDPLFVDPNGGDYHLQSEGRRWDDVGHRWTADAATSPCIDAGDPGRSLGDEPDDPDDPTVANVRIDMGAYGGTAQASIAPLGWALLADVDNDGRVHWRDLARISDQWMTDADEGGDLSRDGVVDTKDLTLLACQWRHEAGRVRRDGRGVLAGLVQDGQ